MGKLHFDLLPQPHRDVLLAGLGDIAGDLAGVFGFFASDLARISVLGSTWPLMDRSGRPLGGTIAGGPLAGWAAVRV